MPSGALLSFLVVLSLINSGVVHKPNRQHGPLRNIQNPNDDALTVLAGRVLNHACLRLTQLLSLHRRLIREESHLKLQPCLLPFLISHSPHKSKSQQLKGRLGLNSILQVCDKQRGSISYQRRHLNFGKVDLNTRP